jgi:hypothetical protein
MPTLEHNGLIEMFRENPTLAPRLVETLCHVELPPYASVAVVESALDQLVPVEFRADLVLELRDDQGAIVLAIILELQREKDPRKKRSWPVYVAAVYARKECPVIILVVTPDAEVGAWAAERIDLGLGLSTIQPVVLGPATVPEVTDPAQAEHETELSILSAVAHGNGPNGLAVVFAALDALGRLDQEHAAVYFQIVYDALRAPMQRALEAKIMERQTAANVTFPPFIQRLIDGGELKGKREGELKGLREGELKGLREGELKGLREGELKGKREGELKGLREGELKGKREALLRILARAGLVLVDEDRVRITACEDSAVLDRWMDNILGAKSAADVLV